MTEYRILNYAGADGDARAGILVGDTVLDLERAGMAASSTLALLRDWGNAEPALQALADRCAADADATLAEAARPLEDVRLLAPLLFPGNIFCAASNYADHTAEMGGGAMPDKSIDVPGFFLKTSAQTVVGPDAEINLPGTSTAIDWEAELAVVIGLPCFNVAVDAAMDFVAGYCVMNDMSIRGPRREEATTPQLQKYRADRFRRKNFDGAAPLGPWFTPKAFVADPYDLPIKLWVNDALMQNGNTRDMHFNIAEQISYLSQNITLLPGDVIATGTPAGVGKGRGKYLSAGDRVVTTVGNLGTLAVSFLPPR